ncbi:MAG: MFS transporter [Leptospiraceae bacterium]|nr:MFS transporter [Leptospiraceae bacterium]
MIYAILYFLYFLGHGSYFSTLSPYMLERFGSDARFVFLAGQAAFPLGYFVAGYLSDRFQAIRGILVPLVILHAPCQFFLYWPDLGLDGAIALGGLTRFFFAANMQLLTIATLESLELKGFSISRSAGTLGFFLVHLVLFFLEVQFPGLLATEASGSGTGGRIGSAFLLIFAVACFFVQKNRKGSQQYFFHEAFAILGRPAVLLFFLVSFVYFAGYQTVDYYLGGYLNSRYGMAGVYGGWCLATLLELPFLPLCARIHARYGSTPLFLVGTLAGVLRFALLYADSLSHLPGLIFVQLLHGIHFTGYYMGTIFRLRFFFPEHLYGTGQGMFMILATAAGALVGSYLAGGLLDISQPLPPEKSSEELQYGPVFLASLVVHLAVFFSFLLMQEPEKRKLSGQTAQE